MTASMTVLVSVTKCSYKCLPVMSFIRMLSMGSSDFVINLPDVGLGVIMGFSNLQIAPTIWLY